MDPGRAQVSRLEGWEICVQHSLAEWWTWSWEDIHQVGSCNQMINTRTHVAFSSVIIDYLKQCRAMGFHATLFFYFEYSRQGEEGPITFLQTLLHQLVSRSPFIPPDISKLLTEAYKRRELLSWDELKAAFIGLCEASSKVFLVLDALDECDETSNRQPVIQLLEALKRSKVRILITSRRFAPDIDQLLGHCCNIMVQTADSDIRAYIVNQIARSPRASRLMSEALRDSVISSTLAKSQGM